MGDRASLRRIHTVLPLAGFLVFAIIALFVLGGFSTALDRQWFLGIASWSRGGEALMALLTFISAVAEPRYRVPAAIALIVWLLIAGRRRTALFAFAATAGGAALCSLAKALAARARPDLLDHLDKFDSYSFPSGHAWNGMIFFGEIALVVATALHRRWRVPIVSIGVLLAFLTGWARIALGVHWPSDVLAGWIGGGAWLMLCYGLLLRDGESRTDGHIPR